MSCSIRECAAKQDAERICPWVVRINWGGFWVELRPRYRTKEMAQQAIEGWKREHNCMSDRAFQVAETHDHKFITGT